MLGFSFQVVHIDKISFYCVPDVNGWKINYNLTTMPFFSICPNSKDFSTQSVNMLSSNYLERCGFPDCKRRDKVKGSIVSVLLLTWQLMEGLDWQITPLKSGRVLFRIAWLPLRKPLWKLRCPHQNLPPPAHPCTGSVTGKKQLVTEPRRPHWLLARSQYLSRNSKTNNWETS